MRSSVKTTCSFCALRTRAPPPVRSQGLYPAPRSLPESGEDTLVQAILNLDRAYERHTSPFLCLLIHTHVTVRAAGVFAARPSLSDSPLPGKTETTSEGRRPRTLRSESGPRCGERWPVRRTVAPAPASAAEATRQTEPRVCHFLHSKARVCRA